MLPFAEAAAATATPSGIGMTGLGFTSSEIASNSFAAGIQAAIGNVGAGSGCAELQSIGASSGFITMAIGGMVYLLLGYLGFF